MNGGWQRPIVQTSTASPQCACVFVRRLVVLTESERHAASSRIRFTISWYSAWSAADTLGRIVRIACSKCLAATLGSSSTGIVGVSSTPMPPASIESSTMPISTSRSLASSIDECTSCSAASDASRTSAARSAPEKPLRRSLWPSAFRSTSSAIGNLRATVRRIDTRWSGVGSPTYKCFSKRPARRIAGSIMSGRFVAAMT
mmetsp:Transcript_12429/g.38674  ORF Transcript_12429/g.38674 Transcript_12429/m.38674 type:complete len:201 (-) Transcript_12429:1621-2223(-)